MYVIFIYKVLFNHSLARHLGFHVVKSSPGVATRVPRSQNVSYHLFRYLVGFNCCAIEAGDGLYRYPCIWRVYMPFYLLLLTSVSSSLLTFGFLGFKQQWRFGKVVWDGLCKESVGWASLVSFRMRFFSSNHYEMHWSITQSMHIPSLQGSDLQL